MGLESSLRQRGQGGIVTFLTLTGYDLQTSTTISATKQGKIILTSK